MKNFDEKLERIEDIKFSANYDFIASRIRNIESQPLLTDKDKELYFFNSICNSEALGKYVPFCEAWYIAALKYLDWVQNSDNLTDVMTAYENALLLGTNISKGYLKHIFEHLLYLSFCYFNTTNNTEKVLEIYHQRHKYLTNGNYTATYQLMIKFNFFTEELNPTKYICELWNEHFNIHAVARIIGLDIPETRKLLQKNRKYLQRQDGDDLDYDWETQLEMDDWYFCGIVNSRIL